MYVLLLTLLSCVAPPVGSRTFVGEAHVIVGGSFEGSETHRVLGEDGDVLCLEQYRLTGDPSQDCEDCTWAFVADASDLETLEGRYCDDVGLGSDPWALSLRVGLGFDAETSTLIWQSGRYDWTAMDTVLVTWAGDDAEGDLSWDWAYADRSYYGYE